MSKITWLDWPKTAKQFSVQFPWNISLSVSGKQERKNLASSFPFSDFYILSSLLGCYFSETSCTFHFGQMFNGFITSTFDFYLSLALKL